MLKLTIALAAALFSGGAWAQQTFDPDVPDLTAERVRQEFAGSRRLGNSEVFQTIDPLEIYCIVTNCSTDNPSACTDTKIEKCTAQMAPERVGDLLAFAQNKRAMLPVQKMLKPESALAGPDAIGAADCRQLSWQHIQSVAKPASAPKPRTKLPWEPEMLADFKNRSRDHDFTVCSTAVKKLRAFRTFSDGVSPISFIKSEDIAKCSGGDLDGIDRSHGEMMKGYVSACLAKLEPSAEAGWNTKINGSVLRSSGRLTPDSGYRLPCTATLSGGYLYTARHCIALSAQIQGIRSFTFEPYEGDPVAFALDGRVRSTPFYIGEWTDLYHRSRPQDDVVAIDLRDLIPTGKGDILVGLAEPGEQLFLPGLNHNVASTAALGELVRSAGMDSAPTCRILYRSPNSCLVHSCQTENTSSGAPMIAVRDGKPVIVGIQVGYNLNGIAPACTFEKDKTLSAVVNHAADPTRVVLAP